MANIMLVGETLSEKDEETGIPFSGASGWLLDQMLSAAGIARRECYVTNVINKRGDIKKFCGGKLGALPHYPALAKGQYLRNEFAGELNRLYVEIIRERPNLVITLGATATWAFLKTSGIKQYRGAVVASDAAVSNRLGFVQKLLPTYHPAMVSRDYSARPVAIADFSKAKREALFPEVRRPVRNIWLDPTLLDLATYERDFIVPSSLLSIDIETKGDQITCIGFSPSADSAIVIPLFSPDTNKSYWPNVEQECAALDYVRRWCAMRPSVYQNGMYDLKFLWQRYGITADATEDTMLLHHAWQPEMAKGLGFLATLYTDEASWKFMRKGKKHD